MRTVCDQPTPWESLLPEAALRMPPELARVDALLDDERFFAPFRPFFHPVLGRPSIPIETYLRMMFLKYRYDLGFEAVCAEVTDSITWQRFARIPLEVREGRRRSRARPDGRPSAGAALLSTAGEPRNVAAVGSAQAGRVRAALSEAACG